jgi:hypothetical protein
VLRNIQITSKGGFLVDIRLQAAIDDLRHLAKRDFAQRD